MRISGNSSANNVRISAIIPSFNRADLIGETLRSLLSQSLPPHEVIVVDDGSGDGTPDVVASFGKDVTLVRQANAGPGPARNTGFARACGDVIHFMDSDDLCAPENYALAAAAFAAGADMTYGPWLKTRIAGNLLDPEAVAVQQHPVPAGPQMSALVLMMDWDTVLQPCFFRRELIERAGPYRSDLKTCEDVELLYRITRLARAPMHVPGGLVLYRVHPENQISQQNFVARLHDQARLCAVFQENLDARLDLNQALRRRFKQKTLDVAAELALLAPSAEHRLLSEATWLDQRTRGVRRLARRLAGKLTHLREGHRYTAPYAAAPLHQGQREQIARMGYVLPHGPD